MLGFLKLEPSGSGGGRLWRLHPCELEITDWLADHNDDGAVPLHEVYQYAYSATLRATSRTSLPQHPAFRFDYAGQGALALTRPQAFAASRAVLEFAPGVGFLVLRDGPDGAVVARSGLEIGTERSA